MTPQRIQLSRQRGFRLPLNAKSVARPSKWGNPFVVRWVDCSVGTMCWQVSDGRITVLHLNDKLTAMVRAVELHALHIGPMGDHELDPAVLAELRGHDLACWCEPGAPCHGDTLLDLANGGAP
jgi:hypothetical protein